MDYLLALLTIIIAVVVIDRLYTWYLKGYEKVRTQLEVLKVVSKHECFRSLMSEPESFRNWLAKFLALKGLKMLVPSLAQKDNGIDLVAQYKNGELVYIKCGLDRPEKWDQPLDKFAAQQLVGAMAGDRVKNGLIITMAELSDSVKNYLCNAAQAGYDVKYIDGDDLVKELYDLREVKLPELLERVGIKLRK